MVWVINKGVAWLQAIAFILIISKEVALAQEPIDDSSPLEFSNAPVTKISKAGLPPCKEAWSKLIPSGGHLYSYNTDSLTSPGVGNLGYQTYQKRLNDTGVARQACRKEWTVLIYMSPGDLLPYSYFDLYEMEVGYRSGVKAGSTLRTDVLVEFMPDHLPEVRRLHMMQTPDLQYEPINHFSKGLCQDGDVSQGKRCPLDIKTAALRDETDIQSPIVQQNPKTENVEQGFQSFLHWGINNYPADNYMVIIWGHGQGWTAFDHEGHRNHGSQRYGGLAFSKDGYLTIPQIKRALDDVKHRSLGGRPIDILAADACLMQMLEVANELSDQAEYIVGSAHLQNPFGLPYRTLFHDLNTFPLSEPLGDLELRTLHLGADQAFAAIDMMSAVDGLVSRLDLGNKLKAYIGFQREESERLLQKAAAHRAADFIEDFRGELFPPNPSLEATAKLALRIKLELLDESDFSRLKQYQFAAFRMIDQWVIQTEPVNLKEIQNSLIEAIHRLSVERIPKPRRKKVQEVVKKILEHQRRSLVNGLQSQLVPDAKNDFTMAALSGSSLEFQVVGAMVAFSEAMKEFLFLGGNERRDDIRKVILKTPGFVGGSKDIHVFLAYLEEYIQVYLAGLRPLNPTETKLLNGTRAFMAALSGQDGWNQGAVTGYVQGQNFFWHHYRKNLGDRAFELAEKHFRAVSVWLPESPAELMARWADMNQSQFFQYGKSTEFEEGAWPVWLKLVYLPYSLCEELEEIVYRDFLDQNKPQPAAADLAKWIHHNYGKQYSESHISFCLKYLQMDL